MSALILRSAFSDFLGLSQLGAGVEPGIEETRRMIFIAERRNEHRLPDHFYKAYLDQRLGEVRHVSELPWLALSLLAQGYLERRDGLVRVRSERFLEWHDLLPFISPLCVVVAFLVEERRGPLPGTDPRVFLSAEIGETALVGPLDLHLEDLVERKGLHEIHMHLNGSTELDVLWSYAVADPDGFYREVEAHWHKNRTVAPELYDQMEPGLTPYVIFKRLRAARRVRALLAGWLGSDDINGAGAHAALFEAMAQEVSDRSVPSCGGRTLSSPPSDLLYGPDEHPPVIGEAAWLYATLQHLRDRPGDRVVGTGLYFTLLVLSQIRRLSVQQTDEFGFDQFQKYTMVGVRETLERRYVARFRQLNLRAPFDVLAHLEGRFSPKDTELEGREQIGLIVSDFRRFADCHRPTNASALPTVPPPCLTAAGCPGSPCGWRGRRLTELSLVAHFIKRPHDPLRDAARGMRDGDLRAKVDRQSRVLKRLLRNGTAASLVRGVDAAANELDAGPEPFSAAYRIVRRAGLERATFHAGEDFRHLISGMRAIEEALVFLDLRTGDRIGHATAIGIDPALWTERAGPRSLLRRVDHLDDLVYARQRLAASGRFSAEVVRLDALISGHSHAVYGEVIGAEMLGEEWRLRTMDPEASESVWARARIRSDVPDVADLVSEARDSARCAIDRELEAEFDFIGDMLERHGTAFWLFRRRHRVPPERRREWVEVESDFLSVEAYVALQEHVLKEVNRRDVALEALPTSNLRISHYRSMREHHLFRWLGLRSPDLVNRPVVVIGSDDPGIFATNLKNELAAVAAVLRWEFRMSPDQVARVVEDLNDTARIRRFKPKAQNAYINIAS